MLRRNLTGNDVLGHCLLDQLAAGHQPIRVLQTDWWQMAGIRLSNDPPVQLAQDHNKPLQCSAAKIVVCFLPWRSNTMGYWNF